MHDNFYYGKSAQCKVILAVPVCIVTMDTRYREQKQNTWITLMGFKEYFFFIRDTALIYSVMFLWHEMHQSKVHFIIIVYFSNKDSRQSVKHTHFTQRFSQTLLFHSSHHYFFHFLCEQLSATPWMPSRSDLRKVCIHVSHLYDSLR